MSTTISNLNYSEDALNVKSLFYNKRIMVYVEGEDDVTFWNEMFKEISNDYKLESVGGLTQLKEYISLIREGNKNMIVACDRDHSIYFDEDPYSNPLIVTSYGYSIENTMFCPKNIATQIRRLSRTTYDYTTDVTKWYNEFNKSALKLLVYDIGNHIYEKGISCYGDNCCRYLSPNNNGDKLDEEKINSFISSISSAYKDDELEIIGRKINNDQRNERFKIKGHFITHAATNHIKKRVKEITTNNPTISKEMLYSTFSYCISPCNPACADREFVKAQIRNAFNNVA